MNGTVTAKLTGTVSAEKITISVNDQQFNWPNKVSCPEGGSAETGPPLFQWPHFAEVFQEIAPTGDGSHRYDHEFTIPGAPTTLHYTLIVRAKR